MTVHIYVEEVLIDEEVFSNEDEAINWASEMQDAGYKVRIID
jgi:hypothetical protein